MGGILIRQGDGTWLEPLDSGYALESELQEILASHSELIPGVSAAAKTCREFRFDVGLADIVVVDSMGELTLVECKLASNPQIRREVVGQMFDYASRLWKMDVDDFAAKWRASTPHPLNLDEAEGEFSLRESLARNLADGRFRIVLAVDAINPALKTMIEYLNVMAGPETSVIAVEYSRLTQGSVEILMPHVYGQELAEAKSARNGQDMTVWDEFTYRSWLQEHDPENVERFDFFLRTALAAGLSFTGSTSVKPAGSLPVLSQENIRLGTVSFSYFSSQGTSVEFNFGRMSKLSDEDLPDSVARVSFLRQLRDVPVLQEVAANLESSRFASRKPNVPLSTFSKDAIQKAVDALSTLTGALPLMGEVLFGDGTNSPKTIL